jgi:hypothetical protein
MSMRNLIVYGGVLFVAVSIFRQTASASAQKRLSAAQASRL